MLGVLLGIAVWLLSFLALGLGVLAALDPDLVVLFDVVLTWAQVPVVALTYVTLYREGLPGGASELRALLSWAGGDGGEDVSETAFNPALAGLELGALLLASVGLALCTLFSISILVSGLTVVGGSVVDPTRITFATVAPSNAFATFLAGGVLWHVALFAEGFEGV
ncbi:hypothetical protein BRD00_14305 [Halobacteriales archaeon QS_8_69_26]|nr:MAG: hypothetical protein BRD00_14305 [Halobacteriales archaeon QS_8_69_26]